MIRVAAYKSLKRHLGISISSPEPCLATRMMQVGDVGETIPQRVGVDTRAV